MREDDMKGGLLPAHVPSRLEAALDADGSIRAWRHRLVGQSIAKGSPFEPS
jgi:isoquinoline 1-oxidoreductase beta subunit